MFMELKKYIVHKDDKEIIEVIKKGLKKTSLLWFVWVSFGDQLQVTLWLETET